MPHIMLKLKWVYEDRRFTEAHELQVERWSLPKGFDGGMREKLRQVAKYAEIKKVNLGMYIIDFCITQTKSAINFVKKLWEIAKRDAPERRGEILNVYGELLKLLNFLIDFRKTGNTKYLVAAIKMVE